MKSDDHLDHMLAELDANAAAPADSTLRDLHAELATLADDLRQPLPPDPHEEESALRRAVALVRDIGRNPSPQTLAVAAMRDDNAAPLELGEIGPYKLLAKLGQGGMGTVYKALHTRLEKVVALKVLPAERMNSPESVARFEREMKAVGKLEHPHIVRATDAGEADGTHYLVMEYVEGVDLAALLKRNDPLPMAAACELVRQAALGLQAAHARGMVHRDVKPANLMLARQEFGPPMVKVLDLGLALLAETHAADATGLTSEGHIMGTIDFMAPEQAGDSHAVDARADVYSLGATLYALLTGGSIFHGREFKTVMQKLSALANESAPSIRDHRDDVPEELAAVVHRMLARDPAERFATPADVAAALEPFAAGADLPALLDVAVPDSTGNSDTVAWDTQKHSAFSVPDAASVQDTDGVAQPPSPRDRRRSRRPVFIAAALLGGIVLLAGIVLSLRTKHGEVVVELGEDVPAEMARQIKIEVSGNGDLKVADAAQGWTIDVKEGKYTAQLAGGNDRFQLDKQQVTVTRDKKTFIRVTLKRPVKVAGKAPVAEAPGSPWKPTVEQQAFFTAVAKLPPEKQIDAVRKKLMEANPGFDGKLTHKIAAGRVVNLEFYTDEVTSIWPVRALADLATLRCPGSAPGNGKLSELSPLKGMPLTHLNCRATRVSDLAPLKGMPLTWLNCGATRVSDLSPLIGMPLSNLNFAATLVSDITPLRNLPLRELRSNFSLYNADAEVLLKLLPLKMIGVPYGKPNSPATTFWKMVAARRQAARTFANQTAKFSPQRQIAAVEGKLKVLNAAGTIVSLGRVIKDSTIVEVTLVFAGDDRATIDITPLMAFTKLKKLTLTGGPYWLDISAVNSLPLEELTCTADIALRNAPVLRGMKTLKTINGQPAGKYLDSLIAAAKAPVAHAPGSPWKPTAEQQAFFDTVAKLSPKKQIDAVRKKLMEANPGFDGKLTQVINAGRVVELQFMTDEVTSIWPVRALADLETLRCPGSADGEGKLSDLSPLKGMPLTDLDCGATRVSDLSPLQGMPLKMLVFNNTRVSDLSPLKGMLLTNLNCHATRVSDLSPLKRMPLITIWLMARRFHVADETLLRSLPVKRIIGIPTAEFWKHIAAQRRAAETFAAETAKLPADQQVAAVVALLKKLNGDPDGALGRVIENGAVTEATLVAVGTRDVTPLRAFTKLKKLTLISGPYWLDISAVNSLPLEELTCTADIALRNAPVLRGMKTLKTINGQPAGKYLDALIAAAKSKP